VADRIKFRLQSICQGECSIQQAAVDYQVPQPALQDRTKGGYSRAENSGNNTKLNVIEKLALFGWINTQLLIGILPWFFDIELW
jgi:hypothetical protein